MEKFVMARACFRLGSRLFRRIIEHSGTEATGVVVPGEHIEIYAAGTAFPENGVRCQFGERHWLVAKFSIDFHDCESGSESEQLCIRKTLSGEFECGMFYGLGKSETPNM